MADGHKAAQAEIKSTNIPVRLQQSAHQRGPSLANLTSVNIAQGLVHMEFGFVEPTMVSAISRRAQHGEPLPDKIDGVLMTRVVVPLETLIRLQQQLNQVLSRLNVKRRANP